MNMKVKIALSHIQDALNAVNQAIKCFNSDFSFTSIQQLNLFRSELERMKIEVEASILIPQNRRSSWMGRTICDGWPLESSLGELIARAENSYVTYQNQIGHRK